MKAQYAKLWAIKCDQNVSPFDKITVNLKSGKTKEVQLAGFLYSLNGFHYYAPAAKSEDA